MASFEHGGTIPKTGSGVGVLGEFDIHPERRAMAGYRFDLSVFDKAATPDATKRMREKMALLIPEARR